MARKKFEVPNKVLRQEAKKKGKQGEAARKALYLRQINNGSRELLDQTTCLSFHLEGLDRLVDTVKPPATPLCSPPPDASAPRLGHLSKPPLAPED